MYALCSCVLQSACALQRCISVVRGTWDYLGRVRTYGPLSPACLPLGGWGGTLIGGPGWLAHVCGGQCLYAGHAALVAGLGGFPGHDPLNIERFWDGAVCSVDLVFVVIRLSRKKKKAQKHRHAWAQGSPWW